METRWCQSALWEFIYTVKSLRLLLYDNADNSFSTNTDSQSTFRFKFENKSRLLTVGSSADQVNDLQTFIVEYVQ